VGKPAQAIFEADLVATYRELVRLHSHLSDEVARYKNEIHALVRAVFPEFCNVFADPCRPSALALLKRYPSAQAIREAGVEQLTALLREVAPKHYGRPTAARLVEEARHTGSSGRAAGARSTSLRIVCEQLEQTQKNLAHLEKELDSLMEHDPGVRGLQSVPAFGPKTVAVLRAEVGDVDRFARTDQVIAYAGLDSEIKESGFWKGKAKLSKRGSGHLRRVLYLAAVRSVRLKGSAFGAYYHRLVARGMKKGSALVAVMRKMLAVAAHVMKSGEMYDPTKVGASRAG
jgi:transposase